MTGVELYQSVLKKLSTIPQPFLQDIDAYLSNIIGKLKSQQSVDVEKVMSFSGSWSDMEENDFEDYLAETRRTRQNLFGREINL